MIYKSDIRKRFPRKESYRFGYFKDENGNWILSNKDVDKIYRSSGKISLMTLKIDSADFSNLLS